MNVFFHHEGSPQHPNQPAAIESESQSAATPLPPPRSLGFSEREETVVEFFEHSRCMSEMEMLVLRGQYQLSVHQLSDLPSEVLLLIMRFCNCSGCLVLRQACRYFELVFAVNAVDHLRCALQPPVAAWTMVHATVEQRLEDQRQRRLASIAIARAAEESSAAVMSTVSAQLDENEQADNPLSGPGGLLLDGVGPAADSPRRVTGSNPSSPAGALTESSQAIFSRNARSSHTTKPASESGTSIEESNRGSRVKFKQGKEWPIRPTRYCSDWLRELMNFRCVRHNIRNALFDYSTIEKHSHAAPLLLPNGILCFSRWQLIAVYVRTCERDNAGFEVPNTAKWIKAGYLGSHNDTVTSMRFDMRRKTMLSSSFDGTIKRWNLRDDRSTQHAPSAKSEGLFTCVTSYQISVNGIPANNFQIFSFDVMDLKDIHEQPREACDATCPTTNTALLVCGSESGHVALLQIDDRRSATLGLYNTGEMRVRHIRFLNKPLFASDLSWDAPTGSSEAGVVHVVACTGMGVHILSHTITRRIAVTEVPANNGRSAFTRRTYQYNGSSLHMTRLTTLNFADQPVTLDVPKMWYNWPVSPQHRPTEPSSLSSSSVSEQQLQQRRQRQRPQRSESATQGRNETVHESSEGNPYFTHPCVFFFCEDGACTIASANRMYNDGTASQHHVADAQPVYRWDALSDDAHGATCGKVSPTNAFFVIGTSSGAVKVLAYTRIDSSMRHAAHPRPIPIPLSDGESPLHASGNPHGLPRLPLRIASSTIPLNMPILTPVFAHGGAPFVPPTTEGFANVADISATLEGESFSTMQEADGDTHLQNFFLGPNAHQDPLCKQLCEGAIVDASAPLDAFVCIPLFPAHSCQVTAMHLDSWKVSTVDVLVNVHVYDILAQTLLFSITPGMAPTQIGFGEFGPLVSEVLCMDCEAKLMTQRHILWQNGTLIVSPLPVSSHTLVADFAGEFEVPAQSAKGAGPVIEERRPADSEGYFTSAQRRLRSEHQRMPNGFNVPQIPPHIALSSATVPVQRVPLSFHLLYVVLPPLSFLLLIIFVSLAALKLDGYIGHSWVGITIIHALVLPHYFGVNAYWYKPLLAHYSGVSFIMRMIADACYLVVAPVLYVLKADGFALQRASWIFVSWPLCLAIILAFIAARLEDRFERRHRVTLNPEVARRKYVRVTLTQLLHTLLISSFVAHFSIYFDGTRVEGEALASFGYPSQNAYLVFAPAWVLLLLYSTRVPSLVSFNPNQARLCYSWLHYIGTLLLLFVLYFIFAVAPVVMFCAKYDNWYAHTAQQREWDAWAASHGGSTSDWRGGNRTFATSTPENATIAPVPSAPGIPPWWYQVVEHPSTVPLLNSLPLIGVVSPLILALVIVEFMVTVNLWNHWKQLRRARV